ncbi:gallate dioxygenase [Burkholderia multivorans]|uniref:gallate dioxygenase n=1 Tax=Burkholderia multivorans TaxID=87883 RepID=UPI001C21775C|nr:gallate dioxygenase [Burkholderia multivorans]MBU9205439.1 gallate dioxygenase [Burkholderia multivorans]MCO8353448.1 gallate dioxygenase [Burkholderia multivorans]MCO8385707.1 gallate dioxygenase [Burkholderia multivorans]MCO8406612.1 gallate dioxygenase [Burkholderia multivorans]MCO8434803.1 gallate dioxygenase [Burkholderia multivorans]
MARIIGGIAASHTPTIGFAFDKHKQDDPVWAPIFENFAPLSAWLADKRPDVLLYIFNDHVTSFFFDHYSAFSLGVGEQWRPADEGGGARDLPPIEGHPELAEHIGQSLMTDEFDLSFFQNKALDHGCFSPLSVLCPHEPAWPTKMIPLQMGVLQMPIPSARRFYRLGQALRRAIESYPEDLRVAIVATGGLSHQVHGERSGFNNPEWDERFLDLFQNDPEQLAGMTIAEYAALGGFEGAEVIMWLAMRGALPSNIVCRHRSYYLPSMTGIATAIYESAGDDAPNPAVVERHRARMAEQLAGVEKLPGTYPFSIGKAVKAYRINDYLHRMIEPDHRTLFLSDPEASFEAAGLSLEERDLIRRRDWPGLLRYGVIFFLLEKLGAVTGVSNLHIYAAMRGQTLEDFQRTRNAPGALYSVAGKDADALVWDRKVDIEPVK